MLYNLPINKTKLFNIYPILADKKFVFFTWFAIALTAALKHSLRRVFNDYLIFKSVFYNTLEQLNLYEFYSYLNGDANHYGPIFSLIFAPFALMPNSIGTIFWDISMMLVLFVAVYYLPISQIAKAIICYICLQPLFTNEVNSETNTLIASIIAGSYMLIRKKQDFWAAALIALGTFIKLYGIVGFAFFFFSKRKGTLILSFIFWSIIFFVAPMIISSPEFIIQSYKDWYISLSAKNLQNLASMNQDISVMGMYRRIFDNRDISNLVFLIPGLFLFALQYIRTDLYDNLRYQLYILASTLLFVILFSSGTENCTIIIGTFGFGLWYVIQDKPCSKYFIFLLCLVILSQILSSGFMPSIIRKGFMKKYALQALPYFLAWLTIVWQILFKKKWEKT